MIPVHINVIGKPEPQGSKRTFLRPNGKVGMVDDAGGLKGWRDAIAQAGRDWQEDHRQALLDGPLAVNITFRLVKPKSSPKRRLFPDTKPDLDKLVRAVLDAVTDVLIKDDARVCVLHARKVFVVNEPPGAAINIETLAAA